MKLNYKFFWKSKLSNWTSSTFTVDGITFNCGEQMMMYGKAMLFGDQRIAQRILSESNPKLIKDLGRKVQGFNQEVWDKNKYALVKKGLKCRFEQDESARNLLLADKGKFFVEASPFDRVWGIGFDSKNAIANSDKWGENLLGKILTEISNEL